MVLNDDHCKCLDNVCTSCEQTRRIIESLKNAGFDVAALEVQNNAQLKAAEVLKAEYFPQRP